MRVTYYGRELYHAEERAGHLYIARIPFGDKFRYFYDQAELAAYKAGKAMGGAAKAAGKAAEEAGRNIQGAANAVGKTARNAYMQTKSKINSAKGQKIYEKQVTSKHDYMKNPNSRDIERARQGKSSNPIGRVGAVASRTMRDVGDNISKTANVAGRNIQRAVNAAGKTARNAYMQTKSKINSAKGQKIYEKQVTSKHDYMKNPNSRDIERARQGKSSNPIGRAGVVASRTMRDVGDNISKTANAAGKAMGSAAKAAGKAIEGAGKNISKANKNLQKSLKYSPVGNAYMQTKSKVNSAKGQKILKQQEEEREARRRHLRDTKVAARRAQIAEERSKKKKKEPDIYKHKPKGWSEEYWKEYVYNSKKNKF